MPETNFLYFTTWPTPSLAVFQVFEDQVDLSVEDE